MDRTNASATSSGDGGLFSLAVLSLIAGAAAGLVGALFRLALMRADSLRSALIVWAHGLGFVGFFLAVAVCAVATAMAAWLVRRFSPRASGSGIPEVEAVLNEELPEPPFRLIPVKFVGGVLAIGSGLALGREGPSVHMGGSIAHLVAKLARRSWSDCRVLLAAGAGAGLATAFGAPVAGAVFVLEELVRKFDTRITIATFGASAAAIAVSRRILGDAPDFQVPPLPYTHLSMWSAFLVLGIVAGLLGVAYNRSIIGALAVSDRLARWPVELRAAVVGALVGIVAWFWPGLVGGGDPVTQRMLSGGDAIGTVALIFLLRFGLGSLSYSARTPGGLFAPMLVLGTQVGLIFGAAWAKSFGVTLAHPTAMGIVGMAAFFTAVVRAPITGIILVTEMTGSFTLLLPMLAAGFAAMAVPTMLGDAPIYDALHERTLRGLRAGRRSE